MMMRTVLPIVGLAGLWLVGVLSTDAAAQESTEADAQHNTDEPKQAEQPPPVLTPANPAVPAAPGAVAPSAKPKFGDLTISGYFRGGFGASNRKGRMTCFALAN